jgi:Pentapeptide repeats (8 copies)
MAIQSKMSDRRTKSAIRRIDSFEKNFGKPHLYLAYHAAFPLSLTPDLLYRLWSKFQQDIGGDSLNIPWSAVADLLLSNLCEAVGHELYEMDQTVRAELLRRLKADPDFNIPDSDRNRIGQLADFLLEYVEQQLHSDDPDAKAFAQAQQWLALAYARPGKAVEQIAQTLHKMQAATRPTSANEPELLRLASLVETLAEPLMEAGLEPLLVYFRGIESFARGDLEQATTELASIAASGKIEIGGEELPVPESIRAKWNLPEQPVGADFSDRKLCGRSFKGQDLTGANFSYADLRGANFSNAKLNGANFSNAKLGMQRRWAIGLVVCCFLIALFSGIGIALVGSAFGASLTALGQGVAASQSSDFNSSVLNDLLRWSSLFVLVALAGFYGTSKRKGWQTLWKAWTLALMLSPVFLIIGTFVTGYRLDSNVYNANKIQMTVAAAASAVLFGILSCSIIWRGLKAKWVGTAIALVGCFYIGGAISIGLAISWSSLTESL